MGICIAFWGGFSSFFSIWQLCLLQITPFFVAFVAGLFLAMPGQNETPTIDRRIVLPVIGFAIGFVAFYSLLIATGLTASRLLLYHINSLRLAAGVVILLTGLYILLLDRLSVIGDRCNPLTVSALSMLTGISFAIVYSPCITPTMSEIMAVASQRATAMEGWYLALNYGIGISAALGLTALVLITGLRKSGLVMRHVRLVKDHFSAMVLVLALLNMTGLMRHYKALILGSVL